MKLKSLLSLPATFGLAVCAVGGPSPTAPESSGTDILSLDAVVGEVLSNNASIKAARANWEAMKERVPQARAWEDPRGGFDTQAGRFVSVPQNSFTDQKLMAEQTLPIAGKNRLRGDAASAEAAGAFATFQRRQLDAVAGARLAFHALENAYAQLDLNRKNAGLMRQFVEISRSKYETGAHSEADLLSAQTELAKLDEAAFDFQRDISDAQTRLNTLMHRPPQSALGRPAPPVFAPVALDLWQVESLALTHRPELLIAEQKTAAAQSRLAAARKEWIPEPALRVEGDRYNGASQALSEVDVGFSISLPWFNRGKYRAAIRENQKLVESAEQELDAARLDTLGQVRDQLKKVETFHHHTELFNTKLKPLAEQTAEAKRHGYENDRSGFLELLTAQQTAQEVDSMYWDHLMHYQEALAELESLVGAPMAPPVSSNQIQSPSK